MPRRRFLVKGIVQGVGFRWFVHRAASRLSLSGWVRNRADGDVETEAEGPVEALDRFQEELRQGPSMAQVEAVETTELPEQGGGAGFDIRGW